MRRVLPKRRRHVTAKGHCGNSGFFVTVGFYEDGLPGEVWFDVAKAGTQMKAVGHGLAMMISVALQYGAPLDALLDTLSDFAPNDFPTAFAKTIREIVSDERTNPDFSEQVYTEPPSEEVGTTQPGPEAVGWTPVSTHVTTTEVEIEDPDEWTNPTYTPNEDESSRD